jgi:hypothetical protein
VRLLTGRGPARLGEPIANRKGEARQNIAAVERSVFVEELRAVAGCIHTNGPPFGIGVPDQADSGTEVLIELARDFLGGVSLRKQSNAMTFSTGTPSTRSQSRFSAS